jgi:hypothetical protein
MSEDQPSRALKWGTGDHPSTPELEARAVRRGATDGMPWLVVQPYRGAPFLNGYVRVPIGHPWLLVGDPELELDVGAPGGFTYGPDGDGWLGFDTVHGGDYWSDEELSEVGIVAAPEWALMRKHQAQWPGLTVWSLALIEDYCRRLAAEAFAAIPVAAETEEVTRERRN